MTSFATMPSLDPSETTERQYSEHKAAKEYRDDLMYVFGHRKERKETLPIDFASFVVAFIKPIWDVMVLIWSMESDEDAAELTTRFVASGDNDKAREDPQDSCKRRGCTPSASREG